MITSVSLQLRILGESFLLGVGMALFYDLLRAYRRASTPKTVGRCALDAVFCFVVLFFVFWFYVLPAAGENRFFPIAGMLTGGAGTFFFLSPLLLPLLTALLRRMANGVHTFGRKVGQMVDKLIMRCRIEKWRKIAKKNQKKTSHFGKKGIK